MCYVLNVISEIDHRESENIFKFYKIVKQGFFPVVLCTYIATPIFCWSMVWYNSVYKVNVGSILFWFGSIPLAYFYVFYSKTFLFLVETLLMKLFF